MGVGSGGLARKKYAVGKLETKVKLRTNQMYKLFPSSACGCAGTYSLIVQAYKWARHSYGHSHTSIQKQACTRTWRPEQWAALSFGLRKLAPKRFQYFTNKGSRAQSRKEKNRRSLQQTQSPWVSQDQRSLSSPLRLANSCIVPKEITIYYQWPSSVLLSPLSQFHYIRDGAITILYDSLIKSPLSIRNSIPALTVSHMREAEQGAAWCHPEWGNKAIIFILNHITLPHCAPLLCSLRLLPLAPPK